MDQATALAMIPLLVAAGTLSALLVHRPVCRIPVSTDPHRRALARLAEQAGIYSDHTEFMAYILLAQAGLRTAGRAGPLHRAALDLGSGGVATPHERIFNRGRCEPAGSAGRFAAARW